MNNEEIKKTDELKEEELQKTKELSDEELDQVAGGSCCKPNSIFKQK